jgi:CMP-N,N'-diacetyllegionaminic acid synthase
LKVLITICARGGSKGIPGKNIRPLAGKPLINFTIECAFKLAEKIDAKIALSTDDIQIKDTAEKCGIFSNYLRPDYLGSDTAGKIETINSLLLYEENLIESKYDFILDLDVTSPLRTLPDLEKGFELLKKNEDALTLFSVSNAARNPYFNMVEENQDGFYKLVKRLSDGSFMSRQAAPKVYDLNASFYWYRRSFFDMGLKSPITERSLAFIMDHICFDLDHAVDFDFLEFLMLNNKIDILL